MIIKSSASLQGDYESLSRLAHETGEPIYITRDGEGDLVLLSMEAYERHEKTYRQTQPNETVSTHATLARKAQKERTDTAMTELSLAHILKDLYDSATKGEQVAMIHLFSINYAQALDARDISKKEILRIAGLSDAYVTEISKGVRLAPYVTISEEGHKKIKAAEQRYI